MKLVKNNKTAKSRGYGFVEFEETRAAEAAYNRGDGRKVDGRRILVDREFGRTNRDWLPRRLGGGKGGESRRNREEELYIKEIRRELREAHKDKKDENQKKENETMNPESHNYPPQ